MTHETVTVSKTVTFEIDRGLVPLIRQTLRHGLWTVASCEGEPGKASWRYAYVVTALDYHAAILAQELKRAGVPHIQEGCKVRFPHDDIEVIAQHLAQVQAPLGNVYNDRLVLGADRRRGKKRKKGKKRAK